MRSASPPALIQVERIALERRKRRVLEHILVRAFQDDARRATCLPRLDPAQDMQAPAVAVLQAPEAHFRLWHDEIVSLGNAEIEELLGHLHAHEVRDAVLILRRAAAVAEVP